MPKKICSTWHKLFSQTRYESKLLQFNLRFGGIVKDMSINRAHIHQMQSLELMPYYVASWRSSSVLAYRTCMEVRF
ncbi:hypothetical protein ES332_A01G211600v1 [Gossypium tomentosum]|uniref:Uncharacterized protein n=1 Tax=Gossypium tomentosum TaxID=34277 RepID=A0A5D2RX42_GOSTO|nr:hypothetical protein ES332_A01G211600v1 [Gossypium tomentosum]